MGRRRIVPRIGSGTGVRVWRAEVQRSVRPLSVVVHRVSGERPAQVSLAEDQHLVGELGADGQHEAFGVAVRVDIAADLDQPVGARNLAHCG